MVFTRTVFHMFFLNPWDPWSNKAWSNITVTTSDIWHKPSSSWTDEVDRPPIRNSGQGKVLTGGAQRYSFITPWSPFWIVLQELIAEPFELGVELLPCFLCLLMLILLNIVIFNQFRSATISLWTEVAHNSVLLPEGWFEPDRTHCGIGQGAGRSGWKTGTFALRLDNGQFPVKRELDFLNKKETLNHEPCGSSPWTLS